MSKPLRLSDFRARRIVLEPQDFAFGPKRERRPSDLVTDHTWHGLMDLPDDVAVRTSSHHGTQLSEMLEFWASWFDVIGDEFDQPTYDAILEVADEFHAATFNLMHGFYRQGIGCLRNALELMTVGSACEAANLRSKYAAYRAGSTSLGFGWACDTLTPLPAVRTLEAKLAPSFPQALFTRSSPGSEGGWARRLYGELSDFSHSRPLHRNVDMWASNGPIYVSSAFSASYELCKKVYVLSHLLTSIARDEYIVPRCLVLLVMRARSKWAALARSAFRLLGISLKADEKGA